MLYYFNVSSDCDINAVHLYLEGPLCGESVFWLKKVLNISQGMDQFTESILEYS